MCAVELGGGGGGSQLDCATIIHSGNMIQCGGCHRSWQGCVKENMNITSCSADTFRNAGNMLNFILLYNLVEEIWRI